ncbi:unnamed protein product [Bemisia tabaci]|uniref:Metalloendopeptidase n=2 Tax=Bemisia tabaci TaxID=7038 RepID=A0A9P0AGH8_BEMTA|nr:unnamed protein product [Bemisia tabaci]
MAVSIYLILLILDVVPLLTLTAENSKDSEHVFQVDDEFAVARVTGLQYRTKKLLKYPERLWRRAAVIYKIEPGIGCPNSNRCKCIMRAMFEYTEKTCVRFKERSGERDYVRIFEDPHTSRGAEATLGRGDGETSIRFHPAVWSRALVLHELGHTLSLIDEHRRPDRDEYLEVLTKNVKPEHLKSFDKHEYQEVNLLGEPLDRKSVMMYNYHTFSKSKIAPLKATLKSKFGKRLPIMDVQHLSKGDVRRIRDLYRCDGANQKPKWPEDVYCNFDEEDCGFSWHPSRSWKWVKKEEDGTGGYLKSSSADANRSQGKNRNRPSKGKFWAGSVNFHGLSPIDKIRGPEGCISFKYLFENSSPEEISVQLMKTDLRSPFDFNPKSENSAVIWFSDGGYNQKSGSRTWSWASISTNVIQPFMLKFESTFNDGADNGSVKVDELTVRYTRCENPTNVDQRLMRQRSRVKRDKSSRSLKKTFSWLGSLRDFLKSPSMESSSRSRSESFSRMSSQASSYDGQEKP